MKRLKREYVKGIHGYWRFLCECGQEKIARGDTKAKYCCQDGCNKSNKVLHGDSHTRIYGVWGGMRARCLFNHRSNAHYKDKGISICEEWSSYIAFSEWALSHGYKDNLTIDRINIDGNYEPLNCEWVTRAENTKRQTRDRHPNAKSVCLDNVHFFKSIAKASEYISFTCNNTVKSISATLEKRINNNSTKPYKGFVITKY